MVFTSDFLLFMYSVASSLSTSSTPTAGKEDSCSSSLTVLLMSSMIIWASLRAQMFLIITCEYCSKCFHVGFHHTEKEISYLPVFPGDSYHMRFLAGQKPLEIFNVMGLKMTHTNVLKMHPLTCFSITENNLSAALCLYLLLPLILPKGIPPLHEVGQTQEVNHFSFPVDQSTEDRCVSVRTKFGSKKLY